MISRYCSGFLIGLLIVYLKRGELKGFFALLYSTVGLAVEEVTALLPRPTRLHKKRPAIAHLALAVRFAGLLTKEQWHDALMHCLRKIGYEHPETLRIFSVLHHDGQHLHATWRIHDENGKPIADRVPFVYRALRKACRELEVRYGLERTPAHSDRLRVTPGQREKARRERHGFVDPRRFLSEVVRVANRIELAFAMAFDQECGFEDAARTVGLVVTFRDESGDPLFSLAEGSRTYAGGRLHARYKKEEFERRLEDLTRNDGVELLRFYDLEGWPRDRDAAQDWMTEIFSECREIERLLRPNRTSSLKKPPVKPNDLTEQLEAFLAPAFLEIVCRGPSGKKKLQFCYPFVFIQGEWGLVSEFQDHLVFLESVFPEEVPHLLEVFAKYPLAKLNESSHERHDRSNGILEEKSAPKSRNEDNDVANTPEPTVDDEFDEEKEQERDGPSFEM